MTVWLDRSTVIITPAERPEGTQMTTFRAALARFVACYLWADEPADAPASRLDRANGVGR